MRHLDDAIRRACNGSSKDYVKLRTLMANAVVAQMLPDGVIKGGSAIKMRFGDIATRFTTDLDTVTSTDPDVYAATKAICIRLFKYRNKQAWPPLVEKGTDWDSIYDAQAKGFNVLPSVEEAIVWANDFIAKINHS